MARLVKKLRANKILLNKKKLTQHTKISKKTKIFQNT